MKFKFKSYVQAAPAWAYNSRHKIGTLAVGLLACALGYHVMFGANGLVVYQQKRDEYRQLQEQNRSLQKQNQELEQKIKALKSDPQAIEKEAREQLHYLRQGEVVYTTPQKAVTAVAAHK